MALFKKRNYREQVANVLWQKLKKSDFRSELLMFLKNWLYTESNEGVRDVLESVYTPMNIQKTYLKVHQLCLECNMAEKESIAKKSFIHRVLYKLFPKVFLETQLDLLDSVYVAGSEDETYGYVLLNIKQKSEQWKQYS